MYEISTYSALKICQIEVDFFLPHAGHIWEIYIIKFFKYFRPPDPGFVKGNKSKKKTRVKSIVSRENPVASNFQKLNTSDGEKSCFNGQ